MSAPAYSRPAPESNQGVLLARRLLPPVLREWVERLGGELATVCGYQLGLCDDRGKPTGGVGGKLLRPAFTLLCGAATGARPADVVPAGAAIELLHNASLIHDDIMDGDRERRHRPTVWARFGEATAILAGDALIALGFEVLAAQRHAATARSVEVLAKTLRLLARGQELDLRFESEARVSVDECLTMMTGKTGVLLGCACRLGAAHSGAPAEWAVRFERFGVHLGVAFQLADDLLGIWGDPAVTGKPVGADLLARKKSAPVAAALSAGTTGSARIAALYARPGQLTGAEVDQLTELIEEAGGRDWTIAEADRQVSAAWDLIDGLDLDGPARSSLATLTGTLLNRDH
ncbi:polyprenyl synthetase family protein [Amycolatopsis magusensis]|uniref:Geranylgeranyl diphosphate synthase type I n=1 Tax=Amycolatopsis magusensis TaxID=882444 RepID=A0ABS4Q075_9PSEU|nr:polyprenyl synthetase family protein [Amycolatopsis magusensis]MBP2184523.1 geranylgeranyl diphosphate synthase type I [Amycolatopsis magusensis]